MGLGTINVGMITLNPHLCTMLLRFGCVVLFSKSADSYDTEPCNAKWFFFVISIDCDEMIQLLAAALESHFF